MSYSLTGVTVAPGAATFDGVGTPISETLDAVVHCLAGDPLPGQVDIYWDGGAGHTVLGPGLNPPGSVAPSDTDAETISLAQPYPTAGVWAIRVVVTDCNGVSQLDQTLPAFTLTGPGPALTPAAVTNSGYIPLEPGLHFHVDVGASWGARPASWVADLTDGSAPLSGTLLGPGPHDVNLAGTDIFATEGVYTPTLVVTADDGSVTSTTFPVIDALPLFPTPASTASTQTSAGGTIIMRQDPEPIVFDLSAEGLGALPDPLLYLSSALPQRAMVFERATYVVADGIPSDPPMLGAIARSVAKARSYDTAVGLEDALALGSLNATSRWLPIASDVVAHPEIGSDVSLWSSHFGVDNSFLLHAASQPFIDPAYDYYASGERLVTRAAMVFDGTSWAQSRLPASVPGFAWLMVAVLHHSPLRSWYDIMASPSAHTDADAARDAVLRYDNGYIRTYGQMRLSSAQLHPPTYRGRTRPVILVWSEGADGGTLGVIDALGRHWQDYAHPSAAAYDLRMYLAMNGGVVDATYAAPIDVLELSYYNRQENARSLVNVITRLDGVYGVTGR